MENDEGLKEALRMAEQAHNLVVLQRDKAISLLETAWGIIANAGEGDWTREAADWQEAARRWADQYHAALPKPAGNLRAYRAGWMDGYREHQAGHPFEPPDRPTIPE